MKVYILVFFICCLKLNSFSQQLIYSRWDKINSKSDEFTNIGSLWNLVDQISCAHHFKDTYYYTNNVTTIPLSFSFVNGQLIANNFGVNIKTKKLVTPFVSVCPTYGGENQTFNFESGSMTSNKLYHYGYYEIRAKTPISDKMVGSAFWLWYSDFCNFTNTKYGEIDIFENASNEPTLNVPNIHTGSCTERFMYNLHGCQNFECRKKYYDYEVELAGSFHTYGVNWQKKYIEFYIDNQLFKRIDYIQSIADSNLFTSIDYIDIPLQVALYGYNATSDPLKMVGTSGLDYTIDYFRYYKLKPYVSFVSSSLTSNIIKVTTTSDVENDTYSFSFIPNCLFSTANMNSFSKVTFPLDVTNRTINLNSSQNIHQRHTTTINDVSVFTLNGSTNFENISSNNSYIVNKNTSDISLNNPVSKTIYVAPNINCPQNGGTELLSNNGEYILNAINNVTLNPGFELSLGSTLYIETINP